MARRPTNEVLPVARFPPEPETDSPGASYQLTINRDLQWIAQQQVNASVKRFDAESATVVVGRIPGPGDFRTSASADLGPKQ